MRKLGLLPTVDDALHGFSPDELNNHFSSISVSPHKDPIESFNIASSSSTEGFSFRPVTANNVILAVAHFKSQSWHLNLQSFLICHFHEEYFPRHGKRPVLLPSKRYPLPPLHRSFVRLLFSASFPRFLRSWLMTT